MSVALTIDAEGLQDLVIAVEKLGGAISGDDVRMVMGDAVRNVLRDHFTALAHDAEHHKTARGFGVSPTGVYEEARAQTQEPQLESGGVSVSINQVAIAQRLFGGDIEPVNAKFLAIPARSEAYGKRPREFENLRFILFPSGAGALVEKGGGKKANLEGLVYFWLVKHVHQEPDPSVLPEESAMLDAAMANAQSYITRAWSFSTSQHS
jgi:hypothetical protein